MMFPVCSLKRKENGIYLNSAEVFFISLTNFIFFQRHILLDYELAHRGRDLPEAPGS